MTNWKDFAMHEMIGIAKNEGELRQFRSPLSENPKAQLFQLLEMKIPHLPLGELYNALSSDSVQRRRTAKRLIDPNGLYCLPMMKFHFRLKTVILKLDTHYGNNQTRPIFIKDSYLVARL